MDLKQHLETLECHFTWDLGCSKNELKTLLTNLKDVNQQTCTWLLHYYNLLGYIQHALDSDTEALKYLKKAESVMQEQETEEAGVRLQVNKANLAWIYFLMGDMDKSKAYLEEVESLKLMHPAPPGCDLHPEISGEKGWTLVKSNKSKLHQAIYYLKMALKAEPERNKWHRGLAIAMSKTYTNKSTPEHKDEILKQLKIAHEKEPNSLCLHALYLEKLSAIVPSANIESEMEDLLEETFETGSLEGLGAILSPKQHLQKLECHFIWDLGCSKNEIMELLRNLKDVDQQTCTWLLHYYNLLGYIQHALGSNTEALKYLHKAESVMQEQGNEEAGVRLQVNKANLAWVYFYMGEMDKSKAYLEEVDKLQQMHPAPPGCALHPEISGEKGWTLVKFNKSKKLQAIDYFKMALKAEPERKEWHKGLAIALSRAYINTKCPPDLKAEILKQLKTAHENDPNSLRLHALYLEKLSEVQ
ncbi:hypothetical protein Q8A67_019620 [Cirrhinus molitorella]|uniref:Uncharacterized protein n=1 Tax=Cirrhinus molitorella TaxID=172907 RepID=A0AA88TDU6_9TELE|nr:hypothetical protein Q8A67_019620 [Cirrhinus molitorella]